MFELNQDSAHAGATANVSSGAPELARRGLPVDPGRLLYALSRGRRLLIAGAVVGAVAGVILAKTVVPREYTSSATIFWEPGTPLAGELRQDGRELRTLVDSIKVPGNLAEARRRLALPASVGALDARINVSSNDKSNLVAVAATWSDSETPPRLANTLVDIFLERRVEAQKERLETMVKNVTSDSETAKKQLADARKAYDDFREQNGIADLTSETQVAIEQAAKLRSEADAASAEAQGEEARAASLKKAARRESATTVISTTEMHPQAIRLAQTEADLAGARATLSAEHPKVQALEAQTEGLRGTAFLPSSAVLGERVIGRNPQFDAIQQIMAGSAAQREAALRRQSALLDLSEVAAGRVAKLRVIEGKATELVSAVHLAEAHLDEIEKVRSKASDALRSPASGFRIVDPAIRPEAPSKSHRRLFAMAAPIAAVFIVALYLLARALRGFRVHTARELGFWGAGPVIASSKYPLDPRARRDLTVDLWAYGVQAQGRTLVVPMGADERGLSELVADALNPPDAFNVNGDEPAGELGATLWTGALEGPELRRAARFADRVLVVVSAGAHSAASIAEVPDRVGRTRGVGYILLGVGDDLATLPDRAGDVERFIRGGGPEVPAGSFEVSHA